MNVVVKDYPRQRRSDGLTTLRLESDDRQFATRLDIDFSGISDHVQNPDPLALDLVLIASACYAADKLQARSEMPDCWTRDFNLSVPVSTPEVWDTAASLIQQALQFLSGDNWQFTFRPLQGRMFKRPARRRRSVVPFRVFRPDAACLFSGGVDSLAGCIDLLESDSAPNVLLVSHYDAAAGEQIKLLEPLRKEYPTRVRQARTRVRLDPVAGDEPSLRTRSFLFLALGVCAASGGLPLYAYENGHIALNVPLTPSRAGSCSTRTMHPYFLNTVEQIIRKIGFANNLIRPYEVKTKGECIRDCANPDILRRLTQLSVSCSHPTRRQYWIRKEAKNCGYCYPCIIRRAALNHVGWDRGMDYGLDVCSRELSLTDSGDSGDDLRAVVSFLHERMDERALAASIVRVAATDNVAGRAAMVSRGVREIATLFSAKGHKDLQQEAGL